MDNVGSIQGMQKVNSFSPFRMKRRRQSAGFGDLTKRINNLELSKIQEISNFLNQQLYMKPTESLPRNVESILRLIELISDEE